MTTIRIDYQDQPVRTALNKLLCKGIMALIRTLAKQLCGTSLHQESSDVYRIAPTCHNPNTFNNKRQSNE